MATRYRRSRELRSSDRSRYHAGVIEAGASGWKIPEAKRSLAAWRAVAAVGSGSGDATRTGRANDAVAAIPQATLDRNRSRLKKLPPSNNADILTLLRPGLDAQFPVSEAL
jgi:hypothetical protein